MQGHPATFSKVVYIGESVDGSIHCDIHYKDGNLSISGVIGSKGNGDCTGSCGQIDSDIKAELDTIVYASNWSKVKAFEFLDIWNEYHLNGMKAGTPKQEAFIKEWKAQGNTYSYDSACEALKVANLYEDNGYKYGSSWLKVEVPSKALKFLYSLPEATKLCKWNLLK